MTTGQTIKARRLPPLVVGVVASRADLLTAVRLRAPPDLLELRLDHLSYELDAAENQLSVLSKRAPLIITARDPREGGAHSLSINQRQELLCRFLPHASYIDVELRSVSLFESIIVLARKKKIRCIFSFHDFQSTPSIRSLATKARAAKGNGADIFKVATRTDSAAELQRLLEFFTGHDVDLAVSAMGIGKLGRKSRRKLMRLGSVLNYASVSQARISGQPLLSQIRHWAFASPARTIEL